MLLTQPGYWQLEKYIIQFNDRLEIEYKIVLFIMAFYSRKLQITNKYWK
jgi:hypothetical protein